MFVIDRFEGGYAVCENLNDGEIINIPSCLFPKEASEGSVFSYNEGSVLLDEKQTQQRALRIKQKMDSLWQD